MEENINEKIRETQKNLTHLKQLRNKKIFGMSLTKFILLKFGDMPISIYIMFTSLISSISFTYFYLDVLNDYEIIQSNIMGFAGLSGYELYSFIHAVLSIVFFILFFLFGAFSTILYEYCIIIKHEKKH